MKADRISGSRGGGVSLMTEQGRRSLPADCYAALCTGTGKGTGLLKHSLQKSLCLIGWCYGGGRSPNATCQVLLLLLLLLASTSWNSLVVSFNFKFWLNSLAYFYSWNWSQNSQFSKINTYHFVIYIYNMYCICIIITVNNMDSLTSRNTSTCFIITLRIKAFQQLQQGMHRWAAYGKHKSLSSGLDVIELTWNND